MTRVTALFRGGWLHAAQQYFFAIVAVVAVMTAAVSWWFIVRPAWQDRADRHVAQEHAAAEVAQKTRAYDRQITELSALVDEYRGMSAADRETVARMVPVGRSTEVLFADIHAIVEQNGVSVSAITIEESSEDEVQGRSARQVDTTDADGSITVPEGVKTIELSLTVSDMTYEALRSLLRSFERHVRLLDIHSVSFTPASGEGVFMLRTYYRDDVSDTSAARTSGGVVPDTTITQ